MQFQVSQFVEITVVQFLKEWILMSGAFKKRLFLIFATQMRLEHSSWTYKVFYDVKVTIDLEILLCKNNNIVMEH